MDNHWRSWELWYDNKHPSNFVKKCNDSKKRQEEYARSIQIKQESIRKPDNKDS
jgi:hypothetical protein